MLFVHRMDPDNRAVYVRSDLAGPERISELRNGDVNGTAKRHVLTEWGPCEINSSRLQFTSENGERIGEDNPGVEAFPEFKVTLYGEISTVSSPTVPGVQQVRSYGVN